MIGVILMKEGSLLLSQCAERQHDKEEDEDSHAEKIPKNVPLSAFIQITFRAMLFFILSLRIFNHIR
jgi:hypothetical protein